jgi:oligoendopeptidase F
VPFYYIEYGIAQTGALQVWRNAKKSRSKAIAAYRAGESLGWTRPLPGLFKAAGLRFDFGEKTIGPLIREALKDLEKLDG